MAAFAETSLPSQITQTMQQKRYQHAEWFILVKDLNTNKIVYALNDNSMFTPASVTKMFTMATALNDLGDNFHFKTPVYFIGNKDKSTLNGNLILVGKGDLVFGGRIQNNQITYDGIDHIYANDLPGAKLLPINPLNGLHELAKQIADQGIKVINGDVLIDDRAFETITVRNYVLSPIMINENLIDFQIKPDAQKNQVTINWRPQAPGYQVVNQVKITAAGSPTQIDITTTGNTYYVTGTIAKDSPEIVKVHGIKNPANFAKSAFIQALKEAGIQVNLKTNSEKLPPEEYTNLKPIAEFVSPPFSEYAKLILKVSHNIGADLTPLILAEQHHLKTFEQGMPFIAKFLKNKVKIDQNNFVFADGAGGNENHITSNAVIDLLSYMKKQPAAQYQKFYDGLPILGVDGSLAEAGKNSPARNRIHGKTGTSIIYDLANQRFYSFAETLGGYIEANNGHTLAFLVAVSNTPMESINDAFTIQADVSNVASGIYIAFNESNK